MLLEAFWRHELLRYDGSQISKFAFLYLSILFFLSYLSFFPFSFFNFERSLSRSHFYQPPILIFFVSIYLLLFSDLFLHCYPKPLICARLLVILIRLTNYGVCLTSWPVQFIFYTQHTLQCASKRISASIVLRTGIPWLPCRFLNISKNIFPLYLLIEDPHSLSLLKETQSQHSHSIYTYRHTYTYTHIYTYTHMPTYEDIHVFQFLQFYFCQ